MVQHTEHLQSEMNWFTAYQLNRSMMAHKDLNIPFEFVI